MRKPSTHLTLACGLIALVVTLVAGLNGAEHGLGTLVGAGATPSVAYFSRCAPGTYDLAVLGQHRRASLVLPLGQVSAAGRTLKLSRGRATIAINLAPAVLKQGDIGRAWDAASARLARLVGGVGEVISSWVKRIKS